MTDAALDDLRDALASAYDDLARAREIAERAGVPRDVQPIDQPNMRGWWWETLHIAWGRGALVTLVETAMADPTAAALTATFASLREPVAQLQAQPTPLRPRGTGGSDDTAKLIRQIDMTLSNTDAAIRAIDNHGQLLRAGLIERLDIVPYQEDEQFYADYYDQMLPDEKVRWQKIRDITARQMQKANRQLLKLLTDHPELFDEIPSLRDLYRHVAFWVDEFEQHFEKNPAMCVVFTGQEDGIPFPGGVVRDIRNWLAIRAAGGITESSA